MSLSSNTVVVMVVAVAAIIALVVFIMGNAGHSPVHPQVVAHRGGALLAPENTLVAFSRAVDHHVDSIELDVHLSRDGQIVVIHDPELQRLTGQEGEVSDYTYADLQVFGVSVAKGAPSLYGIQPIPLLSQVLAILPHAVGLQVEIKVCSDGSRYQDIEEKVLSMLEQGGFLERTLFISFDFPTLERLKELNPSVRTGALVSKAYMTQVGAGGPDRIIADMKKLHADYLCINHTYLTSTLAHKVHEAGIRLGVWTVNTSSAVERMAGWPVSAITTDDYEMLQGVLSRRR